MLEHIGTLFCKLVFVAIFASPFVCMGLLFVVTLREMFTWKGR
jgi:hypothetical protein